MLVGTAIMGLLIKPPIMLASAPSIPAITITTFACRRTDILSTRRCNHATPAPNILSTLLPSSSAVTAASSATGISEVPAVTIAM